MSGSVYPSLRGLNDCGGCAGVTVDTPAEINNRPGLQGIAYRIGTHAQFKRSMLARLSGIQLPALAGLKTRGDDDFSIALLDAWATVADVLTFYQERIANESYLRTATERVSLLQLARLIGYELRPGVAASTSLAFMLETTKAPGVPAQTTIDIGTKVQSIPGPGEQPQTFETTEKIEARPEWNVLLPRTKNVPNPRVLSRDRKAYLKGLATGLKPGDGLLFVGSERAASHDSEQWDFHQLTNVATDAAEGWTMVEWSEGLGEAASDARVYALRKRAALFGSNAPDPRTLPAEVLTIAYGVPPPSPELEWQFSLSNPINLDATYTTITPSVNAANGRSWRDSWIILALPTWHHLYKVTEVSESSPRQYTLTGKTTRLTLDSNQFLADKFESELRSVAVFAQSEELEFAEIPFPSAEIAIPRPLQGNSIALAQPVKGITKGRKVLVSGQVVGAETDDPPVCEDGVIESLSDDGLTLTLHDSLLNSYDLTTVKIYANVTAATHGESKQEILGSGDAARSFPQFTLKDSPLTYIASTTPSGAESTLSVYVNNLRWREVSTFYGHGPQERIFITRTEDDGKTTVEFGDGQTGALPPTGRENFRAHYRKGIGIAGNLKPGQLSLLMSRPLGVKSVTNPLPADGAADRESLNDARLNAPLAVLTFDRIVSLQDYEDFARAFSGVAKALATWSWFGKTRGVFVTVAGPDGSDVRPDTIKLLVTAMRDAGDPNIPLRVKTYRPASFNLSASVKINSDYEPSKVLATIEDALREKFSFATRSFGQPVTLSEVIATMQNTPGVEAAAVSSLYRSFALALVKVALLEIPSLPLVGSFLESPKIISSLIAAFPQPGDDDVFAAELLTLIKGPLDGLVQMT